MKKQARKRYICTLVLVLAVLCLLPFYLHAYTIMGGSEIPTVLLGDKILVNNAAYALKLPFSRKKLFRTGTPKRGDFVCLQIPNNDQLKGPFFKRIIGLPGETVELRENQVLVNGQPLPLKLLNRTEFDWVPTAHPVGSTVERENGYWITFTSGKSDHRNHPPTLLAAGQYFLLGDNRDDSLDSRQFGPVFEDVFLGKVIAIFETGVRRKLN